MDVSIIIATYGDQSWLLEGNDTSMSLTADFSDIPIIRLHSTESQLHMVRNKAASIAYTEWLCFVDAGDSLSPDYFDQMKKATGDLRAPRLTFVDPLTKLGHEPFDLTKRDMNTGNPCPIGTLIRYDMFEDAQEFWNEEAYEDWSLFRRAWLLGATIEHTDAMYYAIDKPNSRNKKVDDPISLVRQIQYSHEEWYGDI